jgi:hypothetical protein
MIRRLLLASLISSLAAGLLGAQCFAGTLVVSVSGPGHVVGSSVGGGGESIACDSDADPPAAGCVSTNPDGTEWSLRAIPDDGADFVEWTFDGAIEPTDCTLPDPCEVTVPQQRIGGLHATFTSARTTDCDHPGALPGAGGSDCPCGPNTVSIEGRWYERYNCELEDECVVPESSIAYDVVDEGGYVTARADGEDGVLEGDLCGDIFAWRDTGTLEADERGAWTFSSDDAFAGSSEYEVYASGDEGACVSVGARAPNAPPEIPNPLCTAPP